MSYRRVDDLFIVKSGDYHTKASLDDGSTPLVSCGDSNNGVTGFFDILTERTYQNCLTVAYNGLPLTTKYHPYRFGAKDDVAVLKPIKPMMNTTLLYLAALLDRRKWRYSYGRKCYRQKFCENKLYVPIVNVSGSEELDEEYIAKTVSFQVVTDEATKSIISVRDKLQSSHKGETTER